MFICSTWTSVNNNKSHKTNVNICLTYEHDEVVGNTFYFYTKANTWNLKLNLSLKDATVSAKSNSDMKVHTSNYLVFHMFNHHMTNTL